MIKYRMIHIIHQYYHPEKVEYYRQYTFYLVQIIESYYLRGVLKGLLFLKILNSLINIMNPFDQKSSQFKDLTVFV